MRFRPYSNTQTPLASIASCMASGAKSISAGPFDKALIAPDLCEQLGIFQR